MGQMLYNFYLKADEIGGVRARTKLSMLTKLTSVEAKSIPDTAENIQLFEKTFKAISQEFTASGFKTTASLEVQKPKIVDADKKTTDTLRKQICVFADLTAQRALFMGNITDTYKRVTESIVEAIDVERASIWFLDNARTAITCADLFVRSKGEHSSGTVLSAKDFPAYFKAIETERTLAANDAHTDSQTKEFSQIYLKPLGINSMLDVPIWLKGKMVGVVCHEHVGLMRTWSSDEENFAYLMGNIIAMSIENHKD